MKKHRQFTILLVCVIVSVMLMSTALAHSGRTDSNGGHYNRSTGAYHYHHGYPAHQHPGGICPYSYDDQTSGRSDGSGDTLSSSLSADDYQKKYLEEKQNASDNYTLYQNSLKELDKAKSDARKLKWFMICIVFFSILYYFMSRSKYTKLKVELAKTEDNLKKASVVAALKHDLNGAVDQDKLQSEYDRLRKELFDKYANKSPESFVDMPADTEIGKDGLPRQKGATVNWGPKYTVFKAPSGKRYHRASCGRGTQPIHVYFVRGLTACGICNPHIPDLAWYTEYRRIKSLKEKYSIP